MKYKSILWLILLLAACTSKKNGKEIQTAHLASRNLIADHTIDNQLDSLLTGINCIAKTLGTKYFVTAGQYDANDSNQLLLIPFRKRNALGTSSGFSDLENKTVFICPSQIREFVKENSLSDTADISGYLGLILLHEMGHFYSNTSGSFDEGLNATVTNTTTSQLGEIDMGTTPQIMTTAKKLELKVDSMAVEMVKEGIKAATADCFSSCLDIQLAINGAEFMVFGKRLIGDFGSPQINRLKDKTWTHPNIELRLAFMNYYLNPTSEKKEQIDGYIYEREIVPLHRQLTDPRIFQGDEKILPEDEK